MQTIVNLEQARAWNGAEGRHWADHADRYNAVNAGINDPLFAAAAIGAEDRVLDLGCGTGQTTRIAAGLANAGSAFGIDLSSPMLERAREAARAEGIENVTFEQGDAQVYPFPECGFDVAISRAAVMFFADPVAAFTNIGSALRPGGRLAFAALGDLTGSDLGDLYATVFGRYLPERYGEPGEAGPASLADPGRVTGVLTAAGFTRVTATPLSVPMRFGADAVDAAEFLLSFGPMPHFLRAVGEAERVGVRAALLIELGRHERADGVSLSCSTLLVKAVRP
ncbi:class I SAM-dependent methyltransferase [Prauserella flavalba]|uniref:Methyltransferase n=1 Tax=Prauserella flavalba TaxID=1477506 RepID=A0A318LH21_9PSEU|nr:class I SAM-dependent methyltransferase [Prauserella flavalba]PXY24042.1 methyltransferase [Prauserella flavalba]